jgi:hypothetical protein
MPNNNSTYSLNIIINTLCKNEEEQSNVKKALHDVLNLYQWEYQNTENYQQYRDAENGAKIAIDKVVQLLRNQGENKLAEDVKFAIYPDSKYSTLTKSKVLSLVKKSIKKKLVEEYGISESRYNKNIAKRIVTAFEEWCKKYPLSKSPDHFDSSWEAPF